MRRVVPVACVALGLACGFFTASPEDVATRFWEAMRAGDTNAARALATTPTALDVEQLLNTLEIEAVVTGVALQNDAEAVVPTSIAIVRDDAPLRPTFDTQLVLEGGQWRVDVAATGRELDSAVIAARMRVLGEALSEGVEELGAAFEAGAAEAIDALIDALEEIEAQRPTDP